MLGKPVIKGTRIPVELIIKKLAARISVDAILADYPGLSIHHIQAALEYAADTLGCDETYLTGTQA